MGPAQAVMPCARRGAGATGRGDQGP